jgi:hypothetical protein
MKHTLPLALLLVLILSGAWVTASVVPAPRPTDPEASTDTTRGAPIPPPDPDDPLIFDVQPFEAQQGQQVSIQGFNFGSAPQVTFNGTVAPIFERRTHNAVMTVVVPSGATSGPLIVTNTDTAEASNPADLIVAPGTYTPACSLVGTITDNTMAPLADATIVATDPTTGLVVGTDVSDASGNYSVGLPAVGEYQMSIRPPHGTPFVLMRDVAACPGTLNHQFVVGSQVSGRLVETQIPNDPVPNALIYIWMAGGGGNARKASDANGEFSFYVTDGTYNLFIIGPPGGRQITQFLPGLVVSGATPLGDIALDLGWLLSGTAQYKDDTGTRPAGVAVELTDSEGGFAGYTYSLLDGRFWLPGPAGTDNTLTLGGGGVDLEVRSIDLTSDTGMDHPLTVYSPDAHIPTLPMIIETEYLSLQPGQPTSIDGVNFGGSSVSVRFPDGVGGWVDGDDTVVDPIRGLIATRVPALAVSGNVHVRVDGVDGPGYPLTIDPGVHVPGSYTVSGTVTDGSDPVEGVLVALTHSDCDHEDLVDYDVTDASGFYTLHHSTGHHWMYILPPVASGLTFDATEFPNLTGNTVMNRVLGVGESVSGRLVDSGTGPVGATSAPIRNVLIEAEGPGYEWLLSDASGLVSMHLASGSYDLYFEGPQRSRYLKNYVFTGAPADLGDVPLDSGHFVEGYIVDEAGVGLPGIEVTATDTGTWVTQGSTLTLGDSGYFRLAVPVGVYNIDFWMHSELDYYLPSLPDVNVWTDTLFYPDFEAVQAAHIQGTVYRDDGTTPVPDVGVSATDFISGFWSGWTASCADGSYDLRLGPSSYTLTAWPENDPCLAAEHYEETPYSCNASPVAVTSSSPATGIDFTLDPGGSISGRVEDDWASGMSDVSVCVDEGLTSPCALDCTWTEGDGSYTLNHVPVGANRRVRAYSWMYPEECWDDHVECTDYDPVPVNECLNSSGIDFTLSDTPGPVPDSHYVSGAPLMTTYDQLTNNLTLMWQPTCNAEGHVLYYGNLGQYGVYTQAVCDIGMTGSITVSAPSYDVFFLIAGHTWGNEGSYGVGTGWIERPPAGGAFCGYYQDLSHNCVP